MELDCRCSSAWRHGVPMALHLKLPEKRYVHDSARSLRLRVMTLHRSEPRRDASELLLPPPSTIYHASAKRLRMKERYAQYIISNGLTPERHQAFHRPSLLNPNAPPQFFSSHLVLFQCLEELTLCHCRPPALNISLPISLSLAPLS